MTGLLCCDSAIRHLRHRDAWCVTPPPAGGKFSSPGWLPRLNRFSMRGRYRLISSAASGYGDDLLPQYRKGTALQRFIASLTIVTLVSWTALAVLPVWFNTAVLAVLIVFVAVVGLIKLVLIALTPP